MPKTAGLSFRATLERHYGTGFRHDYADYPLASPLPQRHAAALEFSLAADAAAYAAVDCIHGHFLPIKYLLLADSLDCRFVTWLREPVQRLVSHYYYWQRSYDPAAEDTSSLHRRVVEEGWTLEQFCLAPELRNVYSQFLWAFPLRALDFVGITEYFAEDLREFAALFLGIKVEPQFANAAEVPAGPDKLP
ncbi:MAG: hypothetical protein ACNA7T_10020, partial [Haliea sp.]